MGKATITAIYYNWYFGEYGEKYESRKVGEDGVIKIEEHKAQGEGDRWYYDISFNDGRTERVFNPNRVCIQEG